MSEPKDKPPVIISVEGQKRELDAKLLLASFTAQRGFPVVVGHRAELGLGVTSIPRGLYLEKSIRQSSVKLFRILRAFGHTVIGLDEEALVHYPPEIYAGRRMSAETIRLVDHLFAWGQDNLELWRQFPAMRDDLPIHLTGNPRADLLRPELKDYFASEIGEIREKYGRFVLLNTNFATVNNINPIQCIFLPEAAREGRYVPMRGFAGMTEEFAKGLHHQRLTTLQHFRELIPRIAETWPDVNLVVRPHPSENPAMWTPFGDRYANVFIDNEYSVVPWLHACTALVHNGCTTGIEAFQAGTPTLAAQFTLNRTYDDPLPNRLGYEVFNFEEFRETLDGILSGRLGFADTPERRALIDHFLVGREGPMAAERMVDAFEEIAALGLRRRRLVPALNAKLRAAWRATNKRVKGLNPRSKYHPRFLQHRFPDIEQSEISERINRLGEVLGFAESFEVSELSRNIFSVRAVAAEPRGKA